MVNAFVLIAVAPIVWASILPHLNNAPIFDRSTTETSVNFSTYAPVRVQCPDRSKWVRPATSLSDEEAAWVQGRKGKVLSGLKSYLGRLHLDGFEVDEYIKKIECDRDNVPTIGMVISGGGWSSAMTGVGALRAFDERFGPSAEQRTGGILQSMTYFSGLSGGSWPPMSLATYNYPMIDDMIAHWHTAQPGALTSPNNTANRGSQKSLYKEIYPKFEAGFNVSWSDFQGRGFAYQFVAGADGGMSTMLSDIAELSNFKNHEMPFPMWQAALSTQDDIEFFGLKVPYSNATLLEFSPLEFGAWQGISSFFPTKYLGTKMSDGKPVDQCIVGFDRASFVLGVCADAANFWVIEDLSNNTLGSFAKRDSPETTETTFPWKSVLAIQKAFKEVFNYTLTEDIYATLPNPFATAASVDNESNPPANLTLLDGSEMGQSLPLWTQIQPARRSDFIVAWDGDQDAHPYSWNNGTNMYNTYIQATNKGLPFPIVPPATTFINKGYATRPTFFGCDANLTNTGDLTTPIVLYLPNAPYSAYTNYSWLEETFSHEQTSVILTNSFNYVTQGNSTLDSEWPECLGCAAIDRSLAKVGMARTEQCQRCMTKYCYDGVEDNSYPGFLDPKLILKPDLSYAEWNKSVAAGFWPEVEK